MKLAENTSRLYSVAAGHPELWSVRNMICSSMYQILSPESHGRRNILVVINGGHSQRHHDCV